MNHRYFIKLSFKGTNYHGWQTQRNAGSVQTILNDSLSVLLKEETITVGAGRTDAGVHAREFYAHFDTSSLILAEKTDSFIYHLNGLLPKDICIHSILQVNDNAHARFSAISRTYEYIITRKKDPFLTGYAYEYHGELDIERMNQGAAVLLACTDFTSFAKLPSETKTNICHVSYARWIENGNVLKFIISSDRFLRNMVRAIVGTLLEIGRGRYSLNDLDKIISSKNRSSAGYSVPACGLYLISILYPDDIFVVV